MVSSGFAMEIHYCMGKVAGLDFYKTENEKCSRCGMKNKKGCCNDEHKFFKLADAHKNVVNDQQIVKSIVVTIHQYNLYLLPVLPSVVMHFSGNLSPPYYSANPLYIQQSVFRI